MSGRLVAAIRMTPCRSPNPSISTSNWLRVCSRSSWPPPRPAPRWRPTASISSTKMMHGLFCLACSNMSRTREAPTPTNISTKSEPEMVKNGHAGLTGDGTGQQRLTGAGRTVEQHALGDLGAQRLVARRVLQEVLDLVELFDRLVDAGHVGERGLGHVLAQLLGLGLAEAEAHPAAGLHPREHHEQADQQEQRQHVDQQRTDDAALVDDGVDLGVLGLQGVEQVAPRTRSGTW